MMNVDVIIPVYRPTEKLKKMLRAIQKQTYKAEHIFLLHTADGHDLSWTGEICSLVPVVEIAVSQDEFDHGGTRDMGICNSKADIVIFMTQDAVPANRFLFENLVKPFAEDKDVAAAYARQIPEKDCGILESYTRKFNYPRNSIVKSQKDLKRMGIKTYFCSNVCAAYRKETYVKLGGFEKHVIFNEDMIFAAEAIRQNYKIAYEAHAAVIHSHDYTRMQQVKRNFDMGVSQACYPEVFENIKSETEGIRLLRQTSLYLLKIKKPFQIVELVIQSGCKYIGYRLGKKYYRLPEWLVMKLTMNPGYWRKRRNINGEKKKA